VASLRSILTNVKAQLVASTGVTANRVLLLARDDTPHFQGDSDLLIRVGKPYPDEGFSTGAGRVAVVLRRPLQVTCRVRKSLDEGDRDDTALLSDTGLIALEEAVVDALHIWVPVSAGSDDWNTVEPIHWLPSGTPVKETPTQQGWLRSDLVFEMRYTLPVSSNGY
jgi:hypothetical protein